MSWCVWHHNDFIYSVGGKFVDIDNITLQNQRKKIQFTDNKRYRPTMGRKKKVKCELVMAMV